MRAGKSSWCTFGNDYHQYVFVQHDAHRRGVRRFVLAFSPNQYGGDIKVLLHYMQRQFVRYPEKVQRKSETPKKEALTGACKGIIVFEENAGKGE